MEQKNLIKLSKKVILFISLFKINAAILSGAFSASFGMAVYDAYGSFAAIVGTIFCFFVSLECAKHLELVFFSFILLRSANEQGVDLKKIVENNGILSIQMGEMVLNYDIESKKWIK